MSKYDFNTIKEKLFSQYENHKLTSFTEGAWRYHLDVINHTFDEGWDNKKYPWNRGMQNFWRYSLAFGSYGIPSLILTDESKYQEAVDCLRKTIILFKDTPVWDGWVRRGQGPDPICCRNVMYKAHLQLLYCLYQLISGSREFESQCRQLTQITANEYKYNGKYRGHWGIECEMDQVFPPCNSQAVLSFMIFDKIFGTSYYADYGSKVADFLQTDLSDPETKMTFIKYHPSHHQAEAYLSGAANAWTLTQMRVTNPKHYDFAFENFKKLLVQECDDGTAYLKECKYSSEPAMGLEEGLGMYYVPGMAKEFKDPDLWAKAMNHLAKQYKLKMTDGIPRLTGVSIAEEIYIENYMLWGAVNLGWDTVTQADWMAVRKRNGGEI